MFDWFKIFNTTEFQNLNLVSKSYNVVLEGYGDYSILVTRSNNFNILFNGVFLSLNLNDKNPFVREGYAIYADENRDVYLGIALDDN